MNKRLLILMTSLLLCGTLSAQGWGTPDSHARSANTPIVASVTIDGETTTLSDDFRLGAFVGTELRGIAAPYEGNFWIQVFYNEGTSETISFKLYDPTNGGTEYGTCTFTYGDITDLTTSVEGYGTPSVPVALNFTNTPLLVQGWNWWAPAMVSESLLSDIETALGNNGVSITSSDGFFVLNDPVFGWAGELQTLEPGKMYMIQTNSACTMSLTGRMPVASSYPVTLVHGYNWIGFIGSESMLLTTALSGLVPEVGDVIMDTENFAIYDEVFGWTGDLNVLVPGKGYMYESKATTNKVFNYPTR